MELKKIGIQTGDRLPVPMKDWYVDALQDAAPDATLYIGKTSEEILAQTDDLDAIIFVPDIVDNHGAEKLVQLPSLKWCQSWVSGVDTVMNSALVEKPEIRISAVRQVHGSSLSDHVVAMVYYFMRNFPALLECRGHKDWKAGNAAVLHEANECTIGLVGLGNIGTEIARKFKSLGFRVLATKRTVIENPNVDHCYPITELDEMLPQCDYVILILPLNSESENLFSAHQFQKMKNSAYLINVARGAIVNDEEMLQALDNGEIAGAALDAFHMEPLPEGHPFWNHKKIFMSYHQAAVSTSLFDRAVEVIVENIRRYQADEPLLFEDKIGF